MPPLLEGATSRVPRPPELLRTQLPVLQNKVVRAVPLAPPLLVVLPPAKCRLPGRVVPLPLADAFAVVLLFALPRLLQVVVQLVVHLPE